MQSNFSNMHQLIFGTTMTLLQDDILQAVPERQIHPVRQVQQALVHLLASDLSFVVGSFDVAMISLDMIGLQCISSFVLLVEHIADGEK